MKAKSRQNVTSKNDVIQPPSHWDALDALMRPKETGKIIQRHVAPAISKPNHIISEQKANNAYKLPRKDTIKPRKIKIGDLSSIGSRRKATSHLTSNLSSKTVKDKTFKNQNKNANSKMPSVKKNNIKSSSATFLYQKSSLLDANEMGVKSHSFHEFQREFKPNQLFYMSSKPKPTHVNKSEESEIARLKTTENKTTVESTNPNLDKNKFEGKDLPKNNNHTKPTLIKNPGSKNDKRASNDSSDNQSSTSSSILTSVKTVKFSDEKTRRVPARQNHFERLKMRRRSNSDPPAIRPRLNRDKGARKTTVSTNAEATSSANESDGDIPRNAPNFLSNSSPESIKSSSFTNSGHEITQEYLFGQQASLKTDSELRHGLLSPKYDNAKNNNSSNSSLSLTIESAKISRPTPFLIRPERCKDYTEKQIEIVSNATAFTEPLNQLKPLRERRSVSEPNSPTFNRKNDKVQPKKKEMKPVVEKDFSNPSPIIGFQRKIKENFDTDGYIFNGLPTKNGTNSQIATKKYKGFDQKSKNINGNLPNVGGSFDRVGLPEETRRRSEVVKNENNSPVINDIKDNLDFSNQIHESLRPVSRRAAVVATLPDSDLSDLSDTIANLQRNQPFGYSLVDLKRSKWNFPKLNFKGKDKERMKLEDVLANWKYKDRDNTLSNRLQALKDIKKRENRTIPKDEFAISLKHFNNFISQFPNSHNTVPNRVTVNESKNGFVDSISTNNIFDNTRKQKRLEAVWELFDSERTYLIDHLTVLQEIYLEPLQELQCDGFLLSVDARSVFGNVEQLCEVNMKFCHDLLNVVEGSDENVYGNTNAILAAFETFDSVMCPPYQRYCTTYENFMHYRDELKSNAEFTTFIKWCERNERCQRLQLIDFLVSPIQHITKYPLLLDHIARYTDDQEQINSIEGTLGIVKESLKALEGKVTWLTKFQLLQDIQSSVIWPSVCEIDTKTVLPENLRQTLSQQPCDKMLANPNRDLIFEGSLILVENGRYIDIYALLFDDLLMFTTKVKKGKRRTAEVPSSLKRHEIFKDGSMLVVHRQPIALDRFMIYDVDTEQAGQMGLKNAFVMVQENRFQQMTSISMIQAASEESKRSWLSHLASTASRWIENL